MAPQNKRGQKLLKKLLNTIKAFFKHPESSFYVVLLLLEFQYGFRTLGGIPIAL
jgi:hypothetical protein